jgi:hypothetical protein
VIVLDHDAGDAERVGDGLAAGGGEEAVDGVSLVGGQ